MSFVRGTLNSQQECEQNTSKEQNGNGTIEEVGSPDVQGIQDSKIELVVSASSEELEEVEAGEEAKDYENLKNIMSNTNELFMEEFEELPIQKIRDEIPNTSTTSLKLVAYLSFEFYNVYFQQ